MTVPHDAIRRRWLTPPAMAPLFPCCGGAATLAVVPAAVEQTFFRVCAVCHKAWHVIAWRDGAVHQVLWREKVFPEVRLRRRR